VGPPREERCIRYGLAQSIPKRADIETRLKVNIAQLCLEQQYTSSQDNDEHYERYNLVFRGFQYLLV